MNLINNKLNLSSAPHSLSKMDTQKIMLYVIIALLPSLIHGGVVFGARAITLTMVCVAACVAFEYFFNLMLKRKQTVQDLSAVLTGLLFAFNLPSNMPYTIAIIGCFVAIVIVKQLFGGIGKNIVNPAITARIVLLVSFPVEMTTWPVPKTDQSVDAVTAATPLGVLANGGGELPSYKDLFFGFVGGSLGEVSAFLLLLGFIFLLVTKVVSPIIPLSFMGTVMLFALLVPGEDPIFHLFAGGVILGACFMATDYVTTPTLPLGQLIFGIGCGLITMAIRIYGAYPEGVSFSILFMNVVTPHINNFTINLRLKGGIKNGK